MKIVGKKQTTHTRSLFKVTKKLWLQKNWHWCATACKFLLMSDKKPDPLKALKALDAIQAAVAKKKAEDAKQEAEKQKLNQEEILRRRKEAREKMKRDHAEQDRQKAAEKVHFVCVVFVISCVCLFILKKNTQIFFIYFQGSNCCRKTSKKG